DGVALVLLRAPRGFGKTSLLARWLELGLLGPRAVYLSLISSITTADEVWQHILDGLHRAGIPAPGPLGATEPHGETGALEPSSNGLPDGQPAPPPAGPAAVSAALTAHGRPLTLVIDHLHRIDDVVDSQIDQALLELLDHH